MPEKFLDICERPKRRKKDKPVVRKGPVNTACVFTPETRVDIDQRKIRHAMDYHVRNGESVIRIEKYDAGIPANSGRRDNDVLADIQKTGRKIEVDRLREINRERQ